MYLIQAGTRPPIPIVMRVPSTGAKTGGLSSPDIVATRGATSFTAGGAFAEITGDITGLYAYTPAVGELATAGLYRYIFAADMADGEIEVQVVGFDPTASIDDIAAGLLDLADGIETGLTPRGAARLALAALAGKLSGGGTATEIMRNAVADSKARITATVDAVGNRSAITWDAT